MNTPFLHFILSCTFTPPHNVLCHQPQHMVFFCKIGKSICDYLHITLKGHFAMGFDEQFTYHPGGRRMPYQPPAANNPWTNPQPSTPSTQQSNAWSPWTNPPAPTSFTPATTPSSNMSHHYVYQPAFSSGAEPRQQPAARNPWTNPPPTPSVASSSYWSHHAVYNPSFAGSVRPCH